jgi:HTH-type transcriptional regulator / antitoxin HigA
MARNYKELRGKMSPEAIARSEQKTADNVRMLNKIEALMDKGENRAPEEDRLLDLLVKLVQDFEATAYPVGESTPGELLGYMIKQRGMKQVELIPVLGCSKSFISEMISGRREISKANAKKLAAFFEKPVDMFI